MMESKSVESSMYEKTIDHVFNRLSEIFALTAYGVSGIIIMITGFLSAYFNILYEYDKLGVAKLGAISIGGVALFILGLALIFNYSKRSVSYRNSKITQNRSESSNASPLEHAIVAIIQDFIVERQNERQKNSNINLSNKSLPDKVSTIE